MGSTGSQRQKQKTPEPRRHKTTYPKVLYFTAFVGFAIAAWILVYEKFIVDKTTRTEVSLSDSFQSAPMSDLVQDRLQSLHGRWRRPDGGYIIEISNIDEYGKIQAAYYNPRPINVSRAQASPKDNPIQIFIELTDVGYPGATYALTYNRQRDVLQGIYYQPAVNQRFEVVFLRTD